MAEIVIKWPHDCSTGCVQHLEECLDIWNELVAECNILNHCYFYLEMGIEDEEGIPS